MLNGLDVGESEKIGSGVFEVRVSRVEEGFVLDCYASLRPVKVLEADTVEDARQLIGGWVGERPTP